MCVRQTKTADDKIVPGGRAEQMTTSCVVCYKKYMAFVTVFSPHAEITLQETTGIFEAHKSFSADSLKLRLRASHIEVKTKEVSEAVAIYIRFIQTIFEQALLPPCLPLVCYIRSLRISRTHYHERQDDLTPKSFPYEGLYE